MPGLPGSLRDAAMRWIADDPDPSTRDELQRLLAAAMAGGQSTSDPVGELADRMTGPLRFGTAGLRGPVRAGPNGMNVAVVRRATAGLADWLTGEGLRGATVVVGRDARHGSAAFAAATAGVLAAAGFRVRVLDGAVPTPVLAFAVRHLGAAAGVQITASHNPPRDNGYKVYLGDGAQLVPPADARIEAAVTAAPAAVSVPVAAAPAAESVTESYLDRIVAVPRTGARTLRIALTPLHGVGGETCVHALSRSGFDDVRVVASQAAPDPEFPTVGFPNPEEPGATDAVLELAASCGADLAVALDPDADRCALGIPGPDGRWRMLSGDETGVLLADHLLRHGAVSGDVADPLVATTVVSSSMLAALAAAYGARYAETLTGFKWIVRGGPGLVYGYEEALGYCVDPDTVRDKDGIAACVLAADLAASLRAAGSTVDDRLDELALAHGVHRTEGHSLRMEPAARDAAVARLRDDPPPGWDVDRPAPDVLRLRRNADGRRADEPGPDVGRGADTAGAGTGPTAGTGPAAGIGPAAGTGTGSAAGTGTGTGTASVAGTDIGAGTVPATGTGPITGTVGAGTDRVVIRPSGTEPKLKAYLEVVEHPAGPDDLAAARGRAEERLAALRTEVSALLGG